MKHNSGKQKEISHRRLAVAELYNEGNHSQSKLVELLRDRYGIDVTQPTVSSDLIALDKEWKNQARSDLEQVKAHLIAKYYQIYKEAYAAWKLSLENAMTIETTTTSKGTYEKEIKKGQSGNPALLAQAQAALKSIREIVGLDAPIEINWREVLPEGFTQEEVELQFIEAMTQGARPSTE